jgi:geranylgeranyl diphosphate synthase type II
MTGKTPKDYLQWIESEIKKQKFGSNPHSLYEPLRYIMQLGGKRLRPLLTLLSYSLYREDAIRIVPVATAVEIFHNFTLLHDDIMDKAPLRRGKATVHEKWNTNTAILSGDVMLVKVYEMLLAAEDSKVREILSAFNQCAAAVCEGQQWDMEFETKSSVTEASYLEMIRLKTAALLGFSLALGAILAEAPEADKKALYELGIQMGIGFQLKDDLLDVYGDHSQFGKQIGGDIIANKKTFLLIKALKLANGKNKILLEYWLSRKKPDKKKKIKAITSLYDALEIRKLTEVKINEYFNLAFQSLEKLSGSPEKKNILKSFARDLIARQT